MIRKFFIVNTIDRPCERLIAELRDSVLFYINPEMLPKWEDQGMSIDEATPLEDFGIDWVILDGVFHGEQLNWSIATYETGKPRKWQGATTFSFPLRTPKSASRGGED